METDFNERQFSTVFLYGSTALVGLFIHTVEFTKSHPDTPHSIGLLWESDQLVAVLYLAKHSTLKSQTSMRPAGFEPAIPAIERPQTHALDHAASGTGLFTILWIHNQELSEQYEWEIVILIALKN
jgi:hypothetical protein